MLGWMDDCKGPTSKRVGYLLICAMKSGAQPRATQTSGAFVSLDSIGAG